MSFVFNTKHSLYIPTSENVEVEARILKASYILQLRLYATEI